MNSPLVTTVVGTSTAVPRPNAPLTPAIAATIANPPATSRMLRRLLRHMALHYRSRLEAGRDHHFVIVHGADRHRARARRIAIEHPHAERVVLFHDGIARDHDDVVFALELDVDGRRQVGHQLRMTALNADDSDEVAHAIGQHARGTYRGHLLDAAREMKIG